jgi:hypothetical protein
MEDVRIAAWRDDELERAMRTTAATLEHAMAPKIPLTSVELLNGACRIADASSRNAGTWRFSNPGSDDSQRERDAGATNQL